MTTKPTPTLGLSRVCRAAVFTVTSATLTVVAHALAGGGLPDIGLTALLTAGIAVIGLVLADRRRSAGGILAVLGASQLAAHVLLSVTGMDMSGGSGMAGMAAHGYTLPMLGTHAVAVLVSAWLLSRADDAVFLIASVLARLLPRLCSLPAPAEAPRHPRPAPAGPDRATTVLLRRSNARRGPPVTA